MRLRFAMLACAVSVSALALTSTFAAAAPRHNRDLTIAASPNPVMADEAVLIYGQLKGTGNAGQQVMLFAHLDGSGRGYTLAGTTTTDGAGYYEFTNQQGVDTNRNWFVRGPNRAHSRTLHERVVPLVSMTASTDATDTAHPIVFTGSVTPNHAYDRVFLQQENGSGGDWRTLTSTQLDAGSHYSIAYRWRRPGIRDVRVLIRRDVRNLAGASDPVTVNIQQAQVPGFTITSSAPITPSGSSVTISGVLDQPGTSTPEPQTAIELWGRSPGSSFRVLGDAMTGSSGDYQFTEANLVQNVLYEVRTVPAPHNPVRRTAPLYQGVQDVLTLQASTTNAMVGQTITLSGTVMPDKAGDVVYLQVQGKDGDWHTAETQVVRHDSTFEFRRRFGSPGTFTFRAKITSDGLNVGGHSTPVVVTVTLPPPSSLPPAS